jgi:hypothetical protein
MGGGDVTSATTATADHTDARSERVDRIVVLWAEITAATREFLRLLAESDRAGDWAAEAFGSCAEWLAWRTGMSKNTANERVRVARALEELPRISDAMSQGALSYSKVRALTRAASAENEAELLEYARASSAAGVERLVRAWKKLDRAEEQKQERVNHRCRRFSVVPDDEGMYLVRGRVTPEVGALLMRAIEAASDALYASDEERDETTPKQRRADALGLLVERALVAGFTGGPVSGTKAERYQVVLHVEAATLAEEGEPGRSELEDGTRISAETARRLTCDASVVELTEDRSGRVLDVGRRTRTVPGALRRALEARDRGCRFPGCGLRFTEAHHIVHWADGGETKLSNAVLLCAHHHRRVHEEGVRVCADETGAQIVFFTPEGKAMPAAPPTPLLDGDPVEALIGGNRGRGVEPDARTGAPRYRDDRFIPWEVEARVWEALDPPEESAAPRATFAGIEAKAEGPKPVPAKVCVSPEEVELDAASAGAEAVAREEPKFDSRGFS